MAITRTSAGGGRLSFLADEQSIAVAEASLVRSLNDRLTLRYGPGLRGLVRTVSILIEPSYSSLRIVIRLGEEVSPLVRSAPLIRHISCMVRMDRFLDELECLDNIQDEAIRSLETHARELIDNRIREYLITNLEQQSFGTATYRNGEVQVPVSFGGPSLPQYYNDYDGDVMTNYPPRFRINNPNIEQFRLRNPTTGEITQAPERPFLATIRDNVISPFPTYARTPVADATLTGSTTATTGNVNISARDILNLWNPPGEGNGVNAVDDFISRSMIDLNNSINENGFTGQLQGVAPTPPKSISSFPFDMDDLLRALFSKISVETTLSLNGDELECAVKLTADLSNGKQISTEVISDSVTIEGLNV